MAMRRFGSVAEVARSLVFWIVILGTIRFLFF